VSVPLLLPQPHAIGGAGKEGRGDGPLHHLYLFTAIKPNLGMFHFGSHVWKTWRVIGYANLWTRVRNYSLSTLAYIRVFRIWLRVGKVDCV